ncbi:MAG: phosphomannomutase/phosphoglucomutase [Sphaerochaetaceae bacterium]|nr:phosphomannomutase/phosphoglucomutase [Sphaerochaetaceae bacterium]MDC7247160.1 phosphomannomutase/phosphoglucomutase [Sphaerochaetaceae bacterium]
MGAFKAYDIRGVYNKDFNKETVYKIGYFLPILLDSDHVIVGRDVRSSSDEIYESLCRGINDCGADVWNIDLATTPMLYFATVFLKGKASVQITASHNPARYNGLKISKEGALPVGENSGLKELEKMVNERKIVVAEQKGKIIETPVRDAYLEYLRSYLPDLSSLNISFDLSHGMANLLSKDLFGTDHHYIYDHFDGTFPAHEPNPLEVENCKDIIGEVLKNKSDIGVIFDGDADRVMFIDEKGRFIQPDYITALLGKYYLEKEKGPVLIDIRTSRSTSEYLTASGADVTTWKVGHAYAKTKLREIKGIFGGELAGHYYFRDFNHCDSGMVAALIVLQVMVQLKKEGSTLSQFIDSVIAYANSGEKNFKLEQKDEAMKALFEAFGKREDVTKIFDFDGYRIEFDSWWFNVRKSNTEPYLRLVVEAKSRDELDEKLKQLTSIINKFH